MQRPRRRQSRPSAQLGDLRSSVDDVQHLLARRRDAQPVAGDAAERTRCSLEFGQRPAACRSRHHARTRRPRTGTGCPNFASQMRAAFASMASNTGSSSPGEPEMTFSTSLVAVCCSSDSVRSSVRWRSSLSSRAFSMAMTACAAKFCHQLDLLVGEGPHLLAVDDDGADQVVILEHRDADQGARAAELGGGSGTWVRQLVERMRHHLGRSDLHQSCASGLERAWRCCWNSISFAGVPKPAARWNNPPA